MSATIHWPCRVRVSALGLLVGFLLALLLLGAGAAGAQTSAPLDDQGRPLYAPGEVLVELRGGLPLTALGGQRYGMASAFRGLRAPKVAPDVHRMQLAPERSVEQALVELQADPAVKSAAPNYYNYPFLTPSDQYFSVQWGLNNTGQTVGGSYSTNNPGTAGSDIRATSAWDLATGSGVIIAVIDTAFLVNHTDFSGRYWDGSGGANCPGTSSAPSNGGCDIANDTNDPTPGLANDDSSHGTHVASLAAAATGSGGIVGVAYNATLMFLQVFQDDPVAAGSSYGATDADVITAIDYATANGAKVINLSLGRSGNESSTMTTAVLNAINAGVVLVAAAGNGGSDGVGDNNDSTSIWPGNYAGHANATISAGFITVLATDQSDQRASFSNYGATTVTIGAPGVNMPGAWYPNTWVYSSGTSMASPMVAGVAALVKSLNPSFTPAQIKTRLVTTGNPIAALNGITSSGRRVNAFNALNNTTTFTAPSAPTGLAASAGDGRVSLSWSAVSGATRYSLYYGTTSAVTTSSSAVHNLTSASYTHLGLANGTRYYYKVSASNADGESELSSEVSATPAVTVTGSDDSLCLITWATRDVLPREALAPLRTVRGWLWSQGPWGRGLVRAYYRASAAVLTWLAAPRDEPAPAHPALALA